MNGSHSAELQIAIDLPQILPSESDLGDVSLIAEAFNMKKIQPSTRLEFTSALTDKKPLALPPITLFVPHGATRPLVSGSRTY